RLGSCGMNGWPGMRQRGTLHAAHYARHFLQLEMHHREWHACARHQHAVHLHHPHPVAMVHSSSAVTSPRVDTSLLLPPRLRTHMGKVTDALTVVAGLLSSSTLSVMVPATVRTRSNRPKGGEAVVMPIRASPFTFSVIPVGISRPFSQTRARRRRGDGLSILNESLDKLRSMIIGGDWSYRNETNLHLLSPTHS
ncbi:Unknown protein, partial [Striga hermonthica]